MKKLLLLFFPIFILINTGLYAKDKTIIDEWKKVKVPNAPELKAVNVDPVTTAFLVLDIQKNSCKSDTRPRCVASIPKVASFLKIARDKKMLVVHSLTSSAKSEDIVNELTPLATENVVRSSVDKFYKTELEKILTDNGIKTVIIAGTVAHGAVLYTATGASLRGLQVIVPVDGMSADNIYAEQYTAWHLLNSPGTRRNSTITKFSLITVR